MPISRRKFGWAGPGILAGMVLSRPSFAQGERPRPQRQGPVPGAVPVEPPADLPAVPFPVDTGAGSVLIRQLSPSRPTVFVFTRAGDAAGRELLELVCKEAGRRAGVGLVSLKTGDEPIARRYEIQATPTAMVFDRRGRFVGRSSEPGEVRRALQKAVGVMRIDWPSDSDPRYAEAARLMGRPVTGGIMRTMTFQPEWMMAINVLARHAHFSPGFLDVRTKEMIASYVSGLNDCKF